MGGFLVDVSLKETPECISIFKERKQLSSFEFNEEALRIVKFKKKLVDADVFIFSNSDSVIIASGTFSYKALSAREGFEELTRDLLNAIVPRLFGHFSILYFNKPKRELIIYFDEAGYGAPYVLDQKFISSSFFACCQFAERLQLHYEAIFEEIFTGCYFNGKTSFREVRKIVNKEVWTVGQLKVHFIPLPSEHKQFLPKHRAQSLQDQLSSIKGYFDNWTKQINEFGGDLGLSSGYDSRLMLGLLEDKVGNKYQVHSYWKKEKDFDNKVAELLATEVNKKLIRIPIRNRNTLSEEEFNGLLYNAMIYYDGLFPSNHGWTREYRTIEHRSKILGNSRFGLSGISGEQYRNDFHLLNKDHSIKSFITEVVIEGNNSKILRDSSFYEKGIELLADSIAIGVGLEAKRSKITREEIQRFYCEMWVPGGPGIRNQIENQLAFFLSPFTDRYLQNIAYSSIPFLGIGGRFQADLISLINPGLASIVSDYGFAFNKVPLKHDVLSFISALVGRKTKMKMNRMMRRRVNYLDSFGVHQKLIESKLESLKDFSFPFPVNSALFDQDTFDRLIALSVLLKQFENKLVK